MRESANHYSEIFARLKRQTVFLKDEQYDVRLKRLIKLEKWILANRKRIQQAVFDDFKKPAEEAELSEVFPVIMEIRKSKKNLKYWMRPRKLPAGPLFVGSSASIHYEPKGLCLIISPWNYPFNLTIGPLVSALSAGNTVMLKPSEFTPNTSRLVREMTEEIFDENEVVVIEGDHEVSAELLKLPFDHIFFTGSPRVGKIIMEAAAKHLSSVTLELGGKSPVIVDQSADLKDAAEKLAWGKWLNAGQTCVAPDYLFVHQDAKTKLVTELINQVKKQYGNQQGYTCIVNEIHHKRLQNWLREAIDQGATIEWQAEINASEGYFPPVIISGVPVNSYLIKEEIFGPILPVLTFEDISEPLQFINERPKPLALYVFGNDNIVNQVASKTSSGTFVGNDCVLQFGHPELPFGGVNNSGIGKSHGHHGFIAFSNEKAVLKQRTGLTMAKSLYPPFNKTKRKILDMMIKFMN